MGQTYASGEEPRVGDVVQHENGDVCAIDRVEDRLVIRTPRPQANYCYSTDRLTLIARAGEPGDVVEVVTSGRNEAGMGTSAGQRLTLTRIESPIGRAEYLSPHGYGYSHEREDSVRLHCCRLVHRPIKATTETPEVAADQPLDYVSYERSTGSWSIVTAGQEVLRIKVPEGRLQPGNTETLIERVRKEIDEVERKMGRVAPEKPAAQSHPNWLLDVINVVEGRQERACAPGKYRVYREGGRVIFEDLRPIEAGCPVTCDRAPGKIGDVKSIDPDTNEAWVRWRNPDNRRDYSTVNRADLRRAPAAPEKSS